MKSYEERAREILECRDTILYEKRMKRKKMEKCVAGVFCLCAVLAVSIKLYNTPELIKHNFNEQIIESKIESTSDNDDYQEPSDFENSEHNASVSATNPSVTTSIAEQTDIISQTVIASKPSDKPTTTNSAQPPNNATTTNSVQPPNNPTTTNSTQPSNYPTTTKPVQSSYNPTTTKPAQSPDNPTTTKPVQPPYTPTTTLPIQPVTTKPALIPNNPTTPTTPPLSNATFNFDSYDELYSWLRSPINEDIDIYDKQFKAFKQSMENASAPMLIPMLYGVPAEIKGTCEWQKIYVFTDEQYNLSWIWYYCNYNGRCVVVGISYLDYLSEIGIAIPKDIKTFMQGIGSTFPNPENKDKYSNYNDIYYDTLTTADGNTDAVIYDFKEERTHYRFITDGCLLSVWDYNNGTLGEDFWSEFSLEEYSK